jgi:hypothetical protein
MYQFDNQLHAVDLSFMLSQMILPRKPIRTSITQCKAASVVSNSRMHSLVAKQHVSAFVRSSATIHTALKLICSET